MNKKEQEDFIRIKEILTCSVLVFIGIIITLLIMVIKVDAEESIEFQTPDNIAIYERLGSLSKTADCWNTNECQYLYNNGPQNYTELRWYKPNASKGNNLDTTNKHFNINLKIRFYFSYSYGFDRKNMTFQVYPSVNNLYLNATCDGVENYNTYLGNDGEDYAEVTYSCSDILMNRNFTYFKFIFNKNDNNFNFYKIKIVDNLKMQDIDTLNDTQNIINNDNKNTDKIINSQKEQTDKILNEGSYTKPNKDGDMNSLDEIENEIYDGEITASTLNEIELTIDEKSSDFWWEQLENALTTNSLVLSTLITILTLGIVKLILRG